MILPIPFTPMNKSIGKNTQPYWNENQYNGYWQEYNSPDGPKWVWVKRPGLTSYYSPSSQTIDRVNGLHYWSRQNGLASVFAGEHSKVNQFYLTDKYGTNTGYYPMSTGTPNPAKFADVAGTDLFIVIGGGIAYYTASTEVLTYVSDPQAPTSVRHIATIDQTLVALRDSSERFDWADAGSPTSWSGEYSNTQSNPDLAYSMIAANNYLYFVCGESVEVWRDDGTTFVRETQGGISRGTSAQYSLTNIKGVLYWLDETREVVRMSGTTIETLSNPNMTLYLDSFATVSDAIGMYIPYSGKHFYVLLFPTENKTIVYDINLNQFYEWSYWDLINAEHTAWLAKCAASVEPWNKVLIGGRNSATIYELTGENDNGNPIMCELVTDRIDRGYPGKRKFCHNITLEFSRADTNTTPKVMGIEWADDGATKWNSGRTVDIERQGGTSLIVRTDMLGSYFDRRWRFLMSDDTQAALTGAYEEFTIGR